MKTVIVARAGDLAVAEHLAEMRAWLDEQKIEARELAILHVLQFQAVFRAVFDDNGDADRFVERFG